MGSQSLPIARMDGVTVWHSLTATNQRQILQQLLHMSECREEEEETAEEQSPEQTAEVRKGLTLASCACQPISQTLETGM